MVVSNVVKNDSEKEKVEDIIIALSVFDYDNVVENKALENKMVIDSCFK